MIILADSGSTKTDWRLISSESKITQLKTQGLNPYQHTKDSFEEVLKTELAPLLTGKITELYFYGAGCREEKSRSFVQNAFSSLFPIEKLEIEDDLTGAIRSLAGNTRAMVAILGTGSNACIAEKGKIDVQIPSLGYVLGDEGSGAHLGKELLRSYLLQQMPADLASRVEKRFELNREIILKNVYKQPFANRYLASFAKWIFQNKEEPFLQELVMNAFRRFFEQYVVTQPGYKLLPFHATGSIAYYFSAFLKSVASEYEVNVGLITESPIAGLTLYHLGE